MRLVRIVWPLATVAGLLLAGAESAPAQTLKLASLRLYPSDVVGPWVTYKVRTQSGRSPVRELTQRVAIVARERLRGENAYWVELKTVDRSGTRIERGLFAPSSDLDSMVVEEGHEPPFSVVSEAGSVRPLKLVRYQTLAPGGKLFEYPIASAVNARASGGVSSYELFEFDPEVRPLRSFLGPDTLRLGRRVVPAVLDRTVRVGSDDWPSADSAGATYRLVLTQMQWRNAAVPITGFARSLLRVTTKRMAASDSTGKPLLGAPDSTLLAFAPADTTIGPTAMQPGEGRLLSWTELTLHDLGADAVAEVTQQPIPAPVTDQPTGRIR